MTADQLFSFANAYVLIGWLLLIFAPNRPFTDKAILYGVIGVLGLLYIYLISGSLGNMDPDSFSSLQGVKSLFGDDMALVAGWVHYLAFDLLAGKYISDRGREIHIPRWQILICLPFTFMFGPVGFVMFLVMRLFHNRAN